MCTIKHLAKEIKASLKAALYQRKTQREKLRGCELITAYQIWILKNQ